MNNMSKLGYLIIAILSLWQTRYQFMLKLLMFLDEMAKTKHLSFY